MFIKYSFNYSRTFRSTNTKVKIFFDKKRNSSFSCRCKFPGSNVYESMISLISIWNQVDEAETFVNKFVTDLHVKYNYIHVKRGEECLEKLVPVMKLLKGFIDSFTKSMDEIFPEQVAIEWLETYFMKRFRSVNQRYEFIVRAINEQKSWLPRPIPIIDKLEINQKNKR